MTFLDIAHFEFFIEILSSVLGAVTSPRGVVCRPRQTRVDVHVMVVIIQGYCFINMPFQEPE